MIFRALAAKKMIFRALAAKKMIFHALAAKKNDFSVIFDKNKKMHFLIFFCEKNLQNPFSSSYLCIVFRNDL